MTASSLPATSPGHAGHLSGQVVGQLGPGEQFILWALRQRLRDGGVRDGEAVSPVFLHGFRLAFGLALLEPALAAFEELFRALYGHCRRDIGLFPLRCACVGVDERAVISLIAAAQAGEGPWLEAMADRLVEPTATAALRKGALAFCPRATLRGSGAAAAARGGATPAGRAALSGTASVGRWRAADASTRRGR